MLVGFECYGFFSLFIVENINTSNTNATFFTAVIGRII